MARHRFWRENIKTDLCNIFISSYKTDVEPLQTGIVLLRCIMTNSAMSQAVQQFCRIYWKSMRTSLYERRACFWRYVNIIPRVAELIGKIILIKLFDHQKDREIDSIKLLGWQKHSIIHILFLLYTRPYCFIWGNLFCQYAKPRRSVSYPSSPHAPRFSCSGRHNIPFSTDDWVCSLRNTRNLKKWLQQLFTKLNSIWFIYQKLFKFKIACRIVFV